MLSLSAMRINFVKLNKIMPLLKHKPFTTFSSATNITTSSRKKVGIWLGVLSGMVIGQIGLGGLTRLTESGLSMTSWKLFKELPIFDEAKWQREFEIYKEYPEYKYMLEQNGEMSLSRFKFIWWMEYSHRMFGRLIGAVLVIQGTRYWMKGYFDSLMKKRFIILGLLTLSQGLLGWYMVKSGLEKNDDPNYIPRVSQYRLAAHLGLAVAMYSILFWNSLSYLKPVTDKVLNEVKPVKMIRGMTHGSKFMIFATIMSGAIVAGIDAGLVYNSYPKMADRWIPTDIWWPELGLRNFLENPTSAQFLHRHLGELTGCIIFGTTCFVFANRAVLPSIVLYNAAGLLALTGLQIGLGVVNLLNYVPTHIASAHQVNSMMVLTAALSMSHALRRIPK